MIIFLLCIPDIHSTQQWPKEIIHYVKEKTFTGQNRYYRKRKKPASIEKEKTRFFFIIVKTFSFLRTRWHCNYASRRRNNNKKEIVYISLKYFWDYRIPQLAFYKITAGNNPWFFPSICSRLWCIALEASTSQLVGWKTSFGSSIASYIYIYTHTLDNTMVYSHNKGRLYITYNILPAGYNIPSKGKHIWESDRYLVAKGQTYSFELYIHTHIFNYL